MAFTTKGRRVQPFIPVLVLAVVFAVLPGWLDSYLMSLVSHYLLFVFIGCAWALLGGYGALVSLGHAAYFGLGGYSLAILFAQFDIHPLVGTALGVLLGMGLLWLFTWVSVRYSVSGIYFAGMTLLAAEGLRALFTDLEIAGRSHGLSVRVENFFGIPGLPATPTLMYYAMLLFAVVGVAGMVFVRASRFGYELMALREDEQAARCLGVRHVRVKYLAAAISGGVTAFAGAAHAQLIGFVEPVQEFGLEVSLTLLFATFLGGRSSPYGPAAGMAVFFGGRELVVNLFPTGAFAAPALVQIIFGMILVIVVMVAPEGIMGLGAQAWRRVRGARGPAEVDIEGAIDRGTRREKQSLTVTGLSKHFGGLRAVDEVDLHVSAGQVKGLIGPNGSGKSTFVNAVTGVYAPTSGRVVVGDDEVTGSEPETINRLGIGRTFQIPRPFSNLTVFENLLVPALQVEGRLAQAAARARYMAKRVGLADELATPAKNLQLAGLRRLELGRALCAEPTLLMCDEAMSGLAIGEQQQLIELLRVLNETEGISLIVIEHILPIVSELCSEVAVLDAGQKIAEGAPEDVLANPKVVEAYIGKVEAGEPADGS